MVSAASKQIIKPWQAETSVIFVKGQSIALFFFAADSSATFTKLSMNATYVGSRST